jgi:hypothetical protein
MIFSMNTEQKMCGFKKMMQERIYLVVRSEISEKCFLGMLPTCLVISRGRHVLQTSPRAVLFSGATSDLRYTNIVPKFGRS